MTTVPRSPGIGRRADERPLALASALASAGLHVLLLVLLATAPAPVPRTTPDGGSAGGRVAVTFIDDGSARARAERALSVPPPTPPEVRATPVPRADRQLAREQPRTPAADPPPAGPRPGQVWGQPPGMLPRSHAPVNAGTAPTPAVSQGRGRGTSSAGPSMSVGGYQVLYDTRSESRLRAWRDQGMTEVFIPLPGTREYMVCPLELALRRESGACRMLAPDDPEMADIGDARKAITMHRVYRRGELMWSGPRAYR